MLKRFLVCAFGFLVAIVAVAARDPLPRGALPDPAALKINAGREIRFPRETLPNARFAKGERLVVSLDGKPGEVVLK